MLRVDRHQRGTKKEARTKRHKDRYPEAEWLPQDPTSRVMLPSRDPGMCQESPWPLPGGPVYRVHVQ